MKTDISVICPSYNNPKYLDFCLHSIFDNQKNKNQIVVVIDGHADKYVDVQKKYNSDVTWVVLEQNVGLPMATNIGVYHAENDRILVVNEDNVFCSDWDVILQSVYAPNDVISINQIEPTPSIFGFIQKDFGSNTNSMRYDEFKSWEKENRSDEVDNGGYLLPFFMNKKWFMAVNGWSVEYSSPFVTDLDFWYKLQLLGQLGFYRTNKLNFYHFGSRSTKKREDGSNVEMWYKGEQDAMHQFYYKWKFYPKRGRFNEVTQ
jgi:glycosyltransferase involved in cell wall biosynthesis